MPQQFETAPIDKTRRPKSWPGELQRVDEARFWLEVRLLKTAYSASDVSCRKYEISHSSLDRPTNDRA